VDPGNGRRQLVLRHLHALTDAAAAGVGDGDLLARYAAWRDEAAFTALVQRHGALVLGVCRRLLANEADAEDAFQATFLVLAKQAGTVRKRASVGSWLYGVACRVAAKARRTAVRRRQRERRAAAERPTQTGPEPACRELQALLDEAMNRLPERYRAALLLCYFEGRTVEEAARHLGCPRGTVASRLAQGRKLLRDRLVRRGLALSAEALTTFLLAGSAPAAVPPALLLQTARVALDHAAGKVAALVPAVALAERVCRAMTLRKLSTRLILALAVGLALVGMVALAQQTPPNEETKAPGPPQRVAAEPARVDHEGDPLPPGAVARLGTLRLRHASWVSSVVFTPDGESLLSASSDIRLWDRATGKELRRFTGHKHYHYGLALSADGKTLVSAGDDGAVRVWELATGREALAIPKAHEGSMVRGVALSPDGKTLASGGGDNGRRALVLWDAVTGKPLHVLGEKKDHVTCVAFSPDGKVLASAGQDTAVCLWDVATGRLRRRLWGHDRKVSSLAFLPDGKRLISGGHDDTLRLWDTTTGRELRQHEAQGGDPPESLHESLKPYNGGVHSVAVSRDGKVLAAGGYNGTVRLWETETGKPLTRWQALSREVLTLTFAPDGKTLAVAGFDHAITLWDPATGTRLLPHQGHTSVVQHALFTPDGRRVVSVGRDLTIRIWDAAAGRELHVLRGHKEWIGCAAISPDGRTLASGSGGDIRLWDVATGKERLDLARQDGHIASLAFSPDGKLLASATCLSRGKGNAVRLWDPATVAELHKLQLDPKDGFHTVGFAGDGKALAVQINRGDKLLSTGDDFLTLTVSLLDVATGKELRRFAGKPGFALSGDSRTLAATREGRIRVWDLPTGKERSHIPTTAGRVGWLTLSPDGRTVTWIYDREMDKTFTLWEVLSGKVRRQFAGHQGAAGAQAFSPDGKTVVSGSLDTTLLVWDLTGGRAPAKELSPKELPALWDDLGSADASKAYTAMCTLAQSPGPAVPFLRERVRPEPEPDPKRLARLLAELDSQEFAAREKATQALRELGEAAEPALRHVLEKQPSLETRQRVERLLKEMEGPVTSPSRLQVLRAVEVFEQAGTAEARAALKVLADGAAAARLTQEARAALGRLEKRAEPGR
jgi:RNA polymerase sigma factor (sigma-70 family)